MPSGKEIPHGMSLVGRESYPDVFSGLSKHGKAQTPMETLKIPFPRKLWKNVPNHFSSHLADRRGERGRGREKD